MYIGTLAPIENIPQSRMVCYGSYYLFRRLKERGKIKKRGSDLPKCHANFRHLFDNGEVEYI
jgi:hypothetical protein